MLAIIAATGHMHMPETFYVEAASMVAFLARKDDVLPTGSPTENDRNPMLSRRFLILKGLSAMPTLLSCRYPNDVTRD